MKNQQPSCGFPQRTMERLEDRILFDAVPDAAFMTVDAPPELPIALPEQSAALDATEQLRQADVARELILVDANLADSSALLNRLLQTRGESSFEVRLLDANADGVSQIGSILSSQSDAPYSAIHILSHGGDGMLQLGSTVLSAQNFSEHSAGIGSWSQGLRSGGDILFYGCDLANGQAGQELLANLQQTTGADVAASTDLTGHRDLGGDWDLEFQIGKIETQAVSVRDYFNTLNVFTIQANTPVTVDGDGGVGTTGTWSNAGFVDTDSTVDSDGDGDFENDADMAVDVVATVIGVTGSASVDFQTVSTSDPLRDDMRARISGDGTATIRWEIFEAGTTNKPTEGKIGLTISDIDGSGGPETVEGVAASLHNLSSYTLQSPTNLDIKVEENFLVAQGTQNQNDEQPSWVRFDWATANELVLTYYVYGNGTRFFNHDGDGDLVFTNPNTNFTQGIDLDVDDSSGASGSNYQATYIDGSIPGVDGDVPVSVADADMQIFDLNDTMLQGATIVLTNASAGDQLNINAPLLAALGISANVDSSDSSRIVVTLTGSALIENYQTAIKSVTYSNVNATFDKSYHRVVEIFATDGTNVTGTANTTINFSNAVNAPTAATDFYVTSEDAGGLNIDAASGLLANDDDPQGDAITVIGARDSAGSVITLESVHILPSGSTILLRADGSFDYTPAAHFSGAEFINYDISDVGGNTATSFLTINVTPVADVPVLTPSYTATTVNEDEWSAQLNVGISTPDSDGSESLKLVVSGIPAGASITDGTNTFVAGATTSVDISSWDLTRLQFRAASHSDIDQVLTLTLTSSEANGDSQSVSQLVSFAVDAVADAPSVSTTSTQGAVDQTVSLAGLINVALVDQDGSEEITSVTISSIPVGAQLLDNGVPLTINAGQVTLAVSQLANLAFVPPASATGTYTLRVSATSEETTPENSVATSSATSTPVDLVITIDNVDDPVTTHKDVSVVANNSTVTLAVLSNDEIPDGGGQVTQVDGQGIAIGQTIILSSGAGTVTLNSDQSLSFNAAAGTSGTIDFTYRAEDLDGDFSIGTAYVSVAAPLSNDTASTNEDTSVAIDVLGNDSTAVLPSTITSQTATDGNNGTTTVNSNGTITYNPNADFHGSDNFTYTVTGLAAGLQYQFFDGLGSWNSLDDIPDIDPDYVGIATDLDSAGLANSLTGSNTDYGVRYYGKLYVENADSYEFSLNSNNGSRIYINGALVTDNNNAGGTTSNVGSVFLSSGFHDIRIEHYDFGGAASLTARMSGADTGGVATNILASGRVGSMVVTQSATVNVTVAPVNDAPTAADDDLAATENQSLSGNVITDNNGNGVDNDPDGDALTVSAVNGSSANVGTNIAGSDGGTFSIASDGTYSFAPGSSFDALAAGETATTSVTYTISDGQGGTSTATVEVTVTGTNDAPTVSGSIPTQSGQDGATISPLDVSGFFDDLDATDTLTFSAGTTLPPGLSINSAGVISGTMAANASVTGPYTVTITASDGTASVSQDFTWNVTNPAPAAADDDLAATENQSLSGNVISDDNGNGADNDPDGDVLTVSAVNGSAVSVGTTIGGAGGGTFNIASDGTYSFNPGSAFDSLAAGETATTSVTYTVSDGQGGTSTATVEVTVTGTNDAPTVSGSIPNQSGQDGGTISPLDVSGFFADLDATDTLTFSAGTTLPPGLSINSAGVISGTIAANASVTGPFTVTITASDGTVSVSQSFTWNVSNPAPTANDDDWAATENQSLSGNVITDDNGNGADNDPDGDVLTVSAVNGSAANVGANIAGSNGGTFNIASDGTYSFNPGSTFDSLSAGETATTSVTYTISDGQGGTSTATVEVTVTGTNDAPTVSGSIPNQSGQDGGTISPLDVSGFFADLDASDTLTFSADTTLPPGLSISSAGVISGAIAANASVTGPFTVTIAASDGTDSVSQSFTWNVSNPTPIAADDDLAATENQSLSGNVITNNNGNGADNDPDGDTLSVLAVNGSAVSVGTNIAGSAGGTFNIASDGTYSFNPGSAFDSLAAGETTTTSVTYTISDGQGGTSTATVAVTVTGTNDAPTVSGSIPTQSGQDGATISPLHISGYFDDLDATDTLTFDAGTTLPPGLAINSSGVISGTIAANASVTGPFTVTITASDGTASVSQSFTWNVSNPAPTATDDDLVATENQSLSGNVITDNNGNGADNDPDGDALTVSAVNGSAANVGANIAGSNGGTFNIASDGTYSFNPGSSFDALAAGETATTSVTYTISDGQGGTSTATVEVTVTGTNDAPTVSGSIPNQSGQDGGTISPLDVSGFFADLDATDTLTFSAGTTLPPGLSISSAGVISGAIAANASVTGPFTVTIAASDGTASVSQSFTWNVTNPAPTAADDDLAATENQSLSGNVITDDNGNGADNDPDGDALTVSAVNGSAANIGSSIAGSDGGTFNITSDGTYSFDPGSSFDSLASGETATTSVTYTISDGQGGTSTATVEITITGTNDAPNVSGSIPTQSGQDGATISPLDVSGFFADVDATDSLTFSAGTTLPPGLSINSAGVISGTIAANASVTGPFTVTITASDGTASVSQDFTWSVSNPAPIAADDDLAATENQSLSGNVITDDNGNGADNDPDGDTLTVSAVNGVAANIGSNIAGSAGGTFNIAADGTYSFSPGSAFDSMAAGETATTSVTYTISDGQGGTSTATVEVTITGTNDAPTVSGSIPNQSGQDGATISPLDVSSLFNDLDATDTLTFSAGTTLPPGLSINSVGVISGTIAANASVTGPFTVTITASDGTASVSQSFTWSVSNPTPTAADDDLAATENQSLNGNVITDNNGNGADNDPDGDTLSVSAVNGSAVSVGTNIAGSAGGTFNIASDGTYSFNPGSAFDSLAAGETATTSVTYTISDGQGGTSTATVEVTVTGTNDTPTVSGSIPTQSGQDGGTISPLDVAGFFDDLDATDTLTFSAGTTLPPGLSINSAGVISGTIAANASVTGPFTVTITASDGMASVSQDFTWNVTNPAPIAQDDTVALNEDTQATASVAGNDSDPDSDALTFSKQTDPANGTVTLQSNGTYTYTPDADFKGSDSFTYQVRDADGATSVATVHVTVNAINDAPVIASAIGDRASSDGDVILLDLSSFFSDVDGDSLDFSTTGLPDGLSISSSGVITGTIANSASQAGPFSVTISVQDTSGESVAQSFQWSVSNPAPVAADDSFSINEDTLLTGDVSAGDSDPDGDTVSFQVLTGPSHGTLSLQTDGTFTYSPTGNYHGSDSFVYQVRDADGATSSATVNITVNSVNDLPTYDGNIITQTSQDSETVNLDLSAHFTDVEGPLVFSATGLPSGLSIDSVGRITGTIDSSASVSGPYTVQVTARDSDNATVNATFQWQVTNPVPNAVGDSFSTSEDTAISGNVGENDTDADGDSLTFTLLTGPGNASLLFQSDGSFVYTPNTNYSGVDSFVYQVQDVDGATATATAVITVGDVNDPPHVDTPVADQADWDGDTISIDLSVHFSDVEGDSLSFTATGLPPGMTLQANGLLTGTLASDASQGSPYTVVVTADDGNGGTVSDTFEWTIQNPSPVAQDDTGTLNEDSSYWGDVSSNDNDPDGDSVVFTKLTDPSNGSVVFFSDGRYQYTGDDDFHGTDSFTYQVQDADGSISTATVHITVLPVNDAPDQSSSLPSQSSNDGDSVLIDLRPAFQDIDGDTLTFAAVSLPPGLTLDSSGIIQGTLANHASAGGPYTINLTVSDSNGGSVQASFTWNISNPAPTATNSQTTAGENQIVSGNVITDDTGSGVDFDPDNDTMQVYALNGQGISATGEVTGSNGGRFVVSADGSYTFHPGTDFDYLAVGESVNTAIQYTLRDAQGATSTATLEITVAGSNDAPQAYGTLPNREHAEGAEVEVNLGNWFGDLDQTDHTSFQVNGLPSGLSVDPSNGLITGTLGEGSARDIPYAVEVTVTDDHGALVTRNFQWRVTPTFAFDAFNNQAELQQRIGIATQREVLLSQRIESLAPEPLLAGSAQPGAILVARIYAADGSVIGEVSTQSDQAGNWSLQFFGVSATQQTRIIIEHVATEHSVLGKANFRLGEETYRSLQLDAMHRDAPTAWSILSDAPAAALEQMHRENKNPLTFL